MVDMEVRRRVVVEEELDDKAVEAGDLGHWARRGGGVGRRSSIAFRRGLAGSIEQIYAALWMVLWIGAL